MDNLRFIMPLYTIADVARILHVKPSTMRSWVRGGAKKQEQNYGNKKPIISVKEYTERGRNSISFIGLAEAFVLSSLRRHGVPMQRIRPALTKLQDEHGIEHALASYKLYTDGRELLFDFCGEKTVNKSDGTALRLVVIRTDQIVMTQVVRDYLYHIIYADDGYAKRIRVPRYENANVVVDPNMSFGQPIFASAGVRVEDVIDRIRGGDDLQEVARDYRVSVSEVRHVWNVLSSKVA